MNKLAIFDLDGVLVSLKDVHYKALNKALVTSGYEPINYHDHLVKYDGLPTKTKLFDLGILGDEAQKIEDIKQYHTLEYVEEYIKPSPTLANIMILCQKLTHLVGVVSNARSETVKRCLELLKIDALVHFVVTPDLTDLRPKPSPEMILHTIRKADGCPRWTTVFEDSPKGIRAAWDAGCNVARVVEPLTESYVTMCLSTPPQQYNYEWPQLSVVIPAAGEGKRMECSVPKPYIKVFGKTMLENVVDNLNVSGDLTIVTNEKHWNPYANSLPDYLQGSIISTHPTMGTAETVLMAYKKIGSNPLLICNADQILEWDSTGFYYLCENTKLDGILVVFKETEKNPKWSYCEINHGMVSRVVEKEVISDIALCGLYFWKRGRDYVNYARKAIANQVTHKGEYYVSPVVNLSIEEGFKWGVYYVDKMHGIGTAADLNRYMGGK